MTAEEKRMRDFISAEIMNREMQQADLDRLSVVLYPHDGTNESVRSAARQLGFDMIKWAKKQNDELEQKHPKPMSDEEIVALAAMM